MMRFTEEHEWVRVEGDVATVGITDYAQGVLGDITYVELPKAGKVFKKGDSLCVVESVKAASDVFAPVGGTVTAVNEALAESPQTVNASPEADGWICTLGGVADAELETLMTAEQYAAFCKK
jgi:glycine cleavage system H protein